MRGLLILVVVLTACTTARDAAPSPTPLPTPSTTATPNQTPTSPALPSPSPIVLPSVAQLSAPSGTVVWAVLGGTRLFRSSDRGDTWVERNLPPVLGNADVAFVDDKNGLLLSAGSAATQCQVQSASIWKTTDGAASWHQVPATGIADGMCKSGIAAADATHALFTAWSPNTAPVIYRSADGAQTWTASTPLPDPPGFTSQGAGFVLHPARPRAFGSIVLVEGLGGGRGTRYAFRSTDSGATWTYASTAPIPEASIGFVTAARWIQVGPPGESKQTLDGGAIWQSYTTDYGQAAPIAPDIVFGDEMVGYATARGFISRTVDGGVHWAMIKTPGT